ncbi:MAG: manC [Burkholderiaceae bacterium]|nr:manC [Burkholderiaceae bacterium]
MKILPVILSGGVGARLWPVSRELHPKPFIRLSDGESLLQKTFLRAAALPGAAEVLTVTNLELLFKTADEYRLVNKKGVANTFMLEPFGRNTAPAIAAAALRVAEQHGNDAIMLVLPADHLIANQPAFAEAVSQAAQLAQQGRLVTFGIQPHTPETGFGYIEADGNEVTRFVEKPTLEKALEYLASGRYLWNAGMFCFTAGTLLEEMAAHAPDVLAAVRGCLAASAVEQKSDSVKIELDAATFREAPDISIDYALMERSNKVAVVPCNIGWSDIGSWNAIADLVPPDANGNRTVGDVLLHDASCCYIQSEDRVVSAIGVRDLVIIDTPDALLVVDKAKVQDVRQTVSQLKQKQHDAYKLHRQVYRPWGTYTVLEEGNRFKIKRIEVKPGSALSLQMHHHRSEHWIVVNGMAKVVNCDREFLVNTNESTFIPAGQKHRLENPGVIDLVMIEVQSGEYLGEDDIVRFEDQYGRA